jgi:hypothetical protein
VPITADGQVGPRWASQPGRGRRRGRRRDPLLAGVHRQLGTLYDQGTEGALYARVARFLRDNQVQVVAADHLDLACGACPARWRYDWSPVLVETPAARHARQSEHQRSFGCARAAAASW